MVIFIHQNNRAKSSDLTCVFQEFRIHSWLPFYWHITFVELERAHVLDVKVRLLFPTGKDIEMSCVLNISRICSFIRLYLPYDMQLNICLWWQPKQRVLKLSRVTVKFICLPWRLCCSVFITSWMKVCIHILQIESYCVLLDFCLR